MSDKKLTDAEIIKALECCGENPPICIECSYKGKCNRKDCYDYLKGDALDLINRLQAENEKWQQVAFKHEETLQIIATEKQHYFDKLQSAKAEIERLKGRKKVELSDGCKSCQHNSVCYEIENLKCRSDFIWYQAEGGCPHFKPTADKEGGKGQCPGIDT